MSKSGRGAAIIAVMPTAKGKTPNSLTRVRNNPPISVPDMIAAKAQTGIDGSIDTAPGKLLTLWAIANISDTACPATHQNGAPNPTMSNSSAIASNGMMTKVVSGIATTLASAP